MLAVATASNQPGTKSRMLTAAAIVVASVGNRDPPGDAKKSPKLGQSTFVGSHS